VLDYVAPAGQVYRARRGEVIGVKTVLTWAAVAFVIYYLVTAPEGAAHVVDVAVDWLKSAGSSLGTFLDHVKL
jgi:hypothetical protein